MDICQLNASQVKKESKGEEDLHTGLSARSTTAEGYMPLSLSEWMEYKYLTVNILKTVTTMNRWSHLSQSRS